MMPAALPMNPVRLAVDLFCRGMRVDPSCDSLPALRRTRAGLGSGFETRLREGPRPLCVNVPVVERFAADSPWVLAPRVGEGESRHVVVNAESGEVHPLWIPDEPAWYGRPTKSSGRTMAEVGTLQGTYLGVYVGGVCGFWSGRGESACGFCTSGLNVGGPARRPVSVAEVVETARAAKEESGVTFVHLNAGYAGESTLDGIYPFVEALKSEVGVLVGVQATPARDLSRYDRLKELGADHLSFCYEFHDPKVLAEVCPGKNHALGQKAYFDALVHCSGLFGRGACSGEIIAGVEPLAKTLEAIEWIASVGAFPTVCIFRPTVGARMEHAQPPAPEDMVVALREAWNACRRHKVPIGLAPNVRVSLIVQVDDAYELIERPSMADRAWRAALAAGRVATRPVFRKRMKARST